MLRISFILLAGTLLAGCAGTGSFSDRLSALKPPDRTSAAVHLRNAVAFERHRDFTEAAESYAGALRRDPQSRQARDGLTRVQLKIASQREESVALAGGNTETDDRSGAPRFAEDAFSNAPPGFAQLGGGRAVPQTRPALPQRIPLETVAKPVESDSEPEFEYPSARPAIDYRRGAAKATVHGLAILPRNGSRRGSPNSDDISVKRPAGAIDYPAPLPSQVMSPFGPESLAITQDIADLQARLVADPSDIAAVEEIVLKLADPDRRKRWLAASVLDHLARGAQRSVVVAQLSRGLRDPDSEVRLQSAVVLATLGSRSIEALPDLRLALQDPNGDVVRACSVAIATIER